jgi:hypothetical protein
MAGTSATFPTPDRWATRLGHRRRSLAPPLSLHSHLRQPSLSDMCTARNPRKKPRMMEESKLAKGGSDGKGMCGSFCVKEVM